MIAATCLTIASVIAAAQPGDSIKLQPGTCAFSLAVNPKGVTYQKPALLITTSFDRPITVDLTGAIIQGLSIQHGGGGLRFVNGTIIAPGGLDGVSISGYGATLNGAHDVSFTNTTFTLAKKAAVVTKSRHIAFDRVLFTGVREDGIITTLTDGLSVTHSQFVKFVARVQRCDLPGGGMVAEQGRRACDAMGGRWTDGNHSDAIQPFNGVTNMVLSDNIVDGVSQGFGQLAGRNRRDGVARTPENWAPLEHVTIERNKLRVTGNHSITMADCLDCKILNNDVAPLTPGRRAPIRSYADTNTIVCGNRSPDAKFTPERCK